VHRDGDPGADTGRGEPHADVHIAVAADVKAVEPVGTESGQHAVAGAEDAGAVAGAPGEQEHGLSAQRVSEISLGKHRVKVAVSSTQLLFVDLLRWLTNGS